jgi:phosphatidylserine synthase
MRAVVPNVLTAARIPLGAAAVVAAAEGRLMLAATLITIGGVTDGIDGWTARRLGVSSPFGALFDCFCDYLCFVVAPWTLARALLSGEPSVARETLLMLPLLTGAVRYANNGLIVSTRSEEVRTLPGLGTVFFAFLTVAAVFLDAPRLMAGPLFAWTMTAVVVLFSLLMVAPITYPKLRAFRGASPVVIVLLACMPFLGTTFLAGVMLVAGLLYATVGPLLARKLAPGSSRAPGARSPSR